MLTLASALWLISIFDCVENTLARQIASELAFALANSYLCSNFETDNITES